MRNKLLVELLVPDLEERYSVYIPINKKIGNITILLSKAVGEFSNGAYKETNHNQLYSGDTGDLYPVDTLVLNTNIRNGSRLILM